MASELGSLLCMQMMMFYFGSSRVLRSITYGSNPRNRLDLYVPRHHWRLESGPRAVVIYITGETLWLSGPFSIVHSPVNIISFELEAAVLSEFRSGGSCKTYRQATVAHESTKASRNEVLISQTVLPCLSHLSLCAPIEVIAMRISATCGFLVSAGLRVLSFTVARHPARQASLCTCTNVSISVMHFWQGGHG